MSLGLIVQRRRLSRTLRRLDAMPVYKVREKFTVVHRVVADSHKDAADKWKAMKSHDNHGELTPLASAMLGLLDRDLKNPPADLPADVREKLIAMPDNRRPQVRKVKP